MLPMRLPLLLLLPLLLPLLLSGMAAAESPDCQSVRACLRNGLLFDSVARFAVSLNECVCLPESGSGALMGHDECVSANVFSDSEASLFSSIGDSLVCAPVPGREETASPVKSVSQNVADQLSDPNVYEKYRKLMAPAFLVSVKGTFDYATTTTTTSTLGSAEYISEWASASQRHILLLALFIMLLMMLPLFVRCYSASLLLLDEFTVDQGMADYYQQRQNYPYHRFLDDNDDEKNLHQEDLPRYLPRYQDIV